MTDPFSITAGAVGIAAAFTACVDSFGYIQFGRHFGRDFQTDQLALDCARLRLTRWGQAVNIYEDPRWRGPDTNNPEPSMVNNILQQILMLFANTEKISKKHGLNAKAGEDISVFSASDMDSTSMAVSNKMKELAAKRQKSSNSMRLAKWALYERSEFRGLLTDITSLIDNIEKLFPAPEIQHTLAQQEAAEFGDKRALELVEDVASGLDSVLQDAAKQARLGHLYSKVVIKGKAQTGDFFSKDWDGKSGSHRIALASHDYKSIEVEKDGKALIGNNYSGKDFWDD